MSFVKSAIRRVLPKNLVSAYTGYRQYTLTRRNQRIMYFLIASTLDNTGQRS
jgi:hypothetical protein